MQTQFLAKQGSLHYEAPHDEIISIDALSVMCVSCTAEEMEDGGEVSWFEY